MHEDEPDFNFGEALNRLKDTSRVCFMARRGWNGPNQRVGIQIPDENSANTMPYLYIIPTQGGRVPWLASQTDMLADDWYECVG